MQYKNLLLDGRSNMKPRPATNSGRPLRASGYLDSYLLARARTMERIRMIEKIANMIWYVLGRLANSRFSFSFNCLVFDFLFAILTRLSTYPCVWREPRLSLFPIPRSLQVL